MTLYFIRFIFLCLLLTSWISSKSKEYQAFYNHLQSPSSSSFYKPMKEEEFFLIILVDACHLDYTDGRQFFQSVAVHPSNGSRRGDVGHAWIYLQGKMKDGTIFSLEGGHSGEKEEPPARYFDGIMNYNQYGYSNPTPEQMRSFRYEPDPIKYLWTMREDGFFQKGSGSHKPTFAIKISLSSKQFQEILAFIRPSRYPYRQYALIGPQCCTFVAKVAQMAGLSLETEASMQVSPKIYFGRRWIRLWEDPRYSKLTFSTPDVLEKSMMEAVKNGKAEYALDWYLNHVLGKAECQSK